MTAQEPPVDVNGYPVQVGDVIKVFHFTDRRRKNRFMYKVVIRVDSKVVPVADGEYWYGMTVHDIPGKWEKAHKYPLKNTEFEIIEGYGPAFGSDHTDRPKAQLAERQR